MTIGRAVLFDLDGVLIDSEPAHFAATRAALEDLGLGTLDEADYARWMLGRPDHSALADYLAARGLSPDLLPALLERKAARYAERFAVDVRPLDDGVETLRAAHAAALAIGIVSGALAAEIAWAIERLGIAGLVAVVVSGDEVACGKPDPEPYLLAARRLGLEPGACVAVEDAPAGVTAARAAGMRCLAVDRQGWGERLAAADLVVTRLSWKQLSRLLRECCDRSGE